MTEEFVGKVAAIVIREGIDGTELLVFDHPLEDGGISVQLPAGTIEPNEAPELAVVRELLEEAGVPGQIIALAGVRDEEWEGEKRRRWVYLLSAPDWLLDEWPSTCDCGTPTRCHWVPFEVAELMGEIARAWVQSSD